MTIAIDPGKSGGIAYRDTDGSVHAVPMPDTVADLDRLLRVLVCPETVCFIEDLPMYRGKMNLRSTAVLFRNFGRIEGVLASLQCRVEYLKPDWWQKALRLGKSADHGERWKAHLKERAQALFPRVEVTLKTADVASFSKLFARWMVEMGCGTIKHVEFEKISSSDLARPATIPRARAAEAGAKAKSIKF